MTSFIQDMLKEIPGVDPRPGQRIQAFSGLNDGPAATAARIAGLVQKSDAKDDSAIYTSNFGQPVPDPCHSLNIGGIPYQGDSLLLEKQLAFDRCKLSERIVHPCGSSAFGYFEVIKDISHLTKAKLFQPGKKTPAYTRFSTVTYGREFPDSARNPRGFATKFYTEDGNYDLVGLNYPVFFVRDPIMGTDNIRSQQRNPKSFMLDYNAWFDFLGNVPESIHAGTMLLSDHSTPKGWIHMNNYGCHTFKWVNAEGKFVWIKYHWLCHQKVEQFTHEEAIKMCGEDPDYSKRELFELLEKGGEVMWTMMIQVMQPEQVPHVNFDPFDPTKIWPRGEFPMQEVGVLVLNRNPENYHRDVEQAAFSPGSFVPGIEASPDPLLQWRQFFYRDAQMHRLGSANIHQIPVNCPFMAQYVSPDAFDGTMRIDANNGGKPQYWPNSYHSKQPNTKGTPGFEPSAAEATYQVADNTLSRKGHYRHEGSPSEYDQVRELYKRVMSEEKKQHLHHNTAAHLKFADPIVQKNYLTQLYAVAPEYAKGVMDLLPKVEGYTLDEIAAASKNAHMVHKNPQFMAQNKGKSFMGMPIGPIGYAA